MQRLLRHLAISERGATAVEYGLVIALIFLAAAGAVDRLGAGTLVLWQNMRDRVLASN